MKAVIFTVSNQRGFVDTMQNRQIQHLIDQHNSLVNRVETVFDSGWVAINLGQRFTLDHGLNRIPGFVQIEFGTTKGEITGVCTPHTGAGTDIGVYCAGRSDTVLTIQALEDGVGWNIATTGVSSAASTSGWIRVTAW